MTTDDIHDFFKKNKFNNKFIDKWQILSIKSDFAKFSENKINNEDFMNDKNEYISLVKLIKKHNLNID